MTGQEALRIIDRLLEEHQRGTLKTIQAEIVLQVWEQNSYYAIGNELGYDPDYIKQVAAQLWKLLSEIVGEKVSKGNLCSILQRYRTSFAPVDWGEAIDVAYFYGREGELETLEHWILARRCRLVGIFGWGGIGKTALSVKLAIQIQSQFECVVWRSLQHAPTLEDLLNEILPILTGSEVQESSLGLLMKQLHQKRCLLVLDNIESIVQQGRERCAYLRGYEAYGEMFDRVCDESHQSCILLTGREKPNGMAQREGMNLPVRSQQLTGLSIAAAQDILADKGLRSSPLDRQNLINYVDGNPLALKLVATTVKNLFGGDIQEFLAQGTGVFSNLQDLLAQQFARFSPLQQQVMYWLAINREAVTPARLKAEFVPAIALPKVLEALETLRDRSAIETTERGLTQQPTIMEYVTERFIQQIEGEIIAGELHLLRTHALMEAQTQDYLREAQIQLILQPLVERLLTHFTTRTDLEKHLERLLSTLRSQSEELTGYAAGNLLNLFCHLKTNLAGYDFSHLSIRQAYLLNTTLHDVDFTGSNFSQSIFAETFGGIAGIAFSPDGNYLATSDTKGDIQIWDARTLEKLSCCKGHQHWTWAVNFSPDGNYLASASDDYRVKLWNPATGECLYTYTGHTYSVNAVAFSHDGKILASSSQDSTIRLWRVLPSNSPPEIGIFSGSHRRVWSIAFSPDDRILVSGGEDCVVRLWDVATGECLAEWEADEGWMFGVAFSPDGKSIATAGYDRTIKIWDITTQECFHTLIGHQQAVRSIAFSPDGRQLVSSSIDRTIKLWDINTGKCLKTLLGHRSRVWNVAFHPNGQQIASGGDDHTTKIWDLKQGRCINTIVGHTNAILSLDVSPNGAYLASGTEDHTIRIWDIQRGTIVHTLREHTNRVWSVKFSPDGSLLASGSADNNIKLWDWQLGDCLQTFQGHKSWVWAVDFSPDSQTLATGSYDQIVKLWDLNTGECLINFPGHTSSVISVAFSPDGKLLASSEFDGLIKLWDLDSGDCCQNLQGHTNSTWSVAFNSDGKWLVSASFDRTIKIWSVVTVECIQTLTGNNSPILNAKFSPDDRFIISAGFDKIIKVWDVETGKCLQALTGHSELIYTLDVANIQPSGSSSPQLIAFSGSLDETIKVWNLDAGECIATWKIRRPYEGMKINKIQGLTPARQATLQALGAIGNMR